MCLLRLCREVLLLNGNRRPSQVTTTKIHPCSRLLGRTHLGGLVCVSTSSDSALRSLVRRCWVMLSYLLSFCKEKCCCSTATDGQARSQRQNLHLCSRLLCRTLVCVSTSSDCALRLAVVRRRWVMLRTRSLPAASSISHPSYRLICCVLHRRGCVLTTNGVEQHQVGGEPNRFR